MEDFITQKDGMSERDIILNQIRRITEKGGTEWKASSIQIKDLGGRIVEVPIPDTRKELIQSIEILEILLSAKFEDKKDKYYGKLMKQIDATLKEYEENKITNDEYIIKKLNIMLEIFRQLMKLLHESRFLEKKLVAG